MRKKANHKSPVAVSRSGNIGIGSGRFLEMPTVLRYSESTMVMARTSIVGTRVRIVKEISRSAEIIGLAKDVEKRISDVLRSRERWEVAPARVRMAVKEVKLLFDGVDDVPARTFRKVEHC